MGRVFQKYNVWWWLGMLLLGSGDFLWVVLMVCGVVETKNFITKKCRKLIILGYCRFIWRFFWEWMELMRMRSGCKNMRIIIGREKVILLIIEKRSPHHCVILTGINIGTLLIWWNIIFLVSPGCLRAHVVCTNSPLFFVLVGTNVYNMFTLFTQSPHCHLFPQVNTTSWFFCHN